MAIYLYFWQRLSSSELPEEFKPETFISVIIPARNEARHITSCLSALALQNYPAKLFEVILVDDHSHDGTSSIAEGLNLPMVRVIRLAEKSSDGKPLSSKKKAIEVGISEANGNVIATTDADSLVPADWLLYISWHIENQDAAFVAGPVGCHQDLGALAKFQSLDFLGMMLITGAGIEGGYMHMCNGANLAYRKDVFEAVQGFEGIDHLASGDDMLLLQKVAQKYPGRIAFIKSRHGMVHTFPKPDLGSFWSQRVRWASKSTSYQETLVTVMLGVVFLLCLTLIVAFISLPFAGNNTLFWAFLFLLTIKVVLDYILLKKASNFFGRPELMNHFFTSQIIHILYIAAIGIRANIRKDYVWKGRRVR